MIFWNCKNHSFAPFALIPWYVSVDQNPFEIAAELANRLKSNPKNILCLIAIENNIARAVVIAYVKRRYVWLWQAKTGKGFKYSRLMFELVKSWAKYKNKKRIRMKTPDREKIFERRWGFRNLGEGIMEYVL